MILQFPPSSLVSIDENRLFLSFFSDGNFSSHLLVLDGFRLLPFYPGPFISILFLINVRCWGLPLLLGVTSGFCRPVIDVNRSSPFGLVDGFRTSLFLLEGRCLFPFSDVDGIKMCLPCYVTAFKFRPCCWHSVTFCASYGLAPSHSWESKSWIQNWRILHSTSVLGWALHRGCPPYDSGALLFRTHPISWCRALAGIIIIADVLSVVWWRSQMGGIVIAGPVRILSYGRCRRGVCSNGEFRL